MTSSGVKRNPITAAAFNVCLASEFEAVDARRDGRLQRGGHTHLGQVSAACVATAVTLKHPAFGKLAHHLLNEERIPGARDQRPDPP